MKTKLCKMCKKRRAGQQEWKTAEEKEMCSTCKSFKNCMDSISIALTQIAKEKIGMNMEAYVYLIDNGIIYKKNSV